MNHYGKCLTMLIVMLSLAGSIYAADPSTIVLDEELSLYYDERTVTYELKGRSAFIYGSFSCTVEIEKSTNLPCIVFTPLGLNYNHDISSVSISNNGGNMTIVKKGVKSPPKITPRADVGFYEIILTNFDDKAFPHRFQYNKMGVTNSYELTDRPHLMGFRLARLDKFYLSSKLYLRYNSNTNAYSLLEKPSDVSKEHIFKGFFACSMERGTQEYLELHIVFTPIGLRRSHNIEFVQLSDRLGEISIKKFNGAEPIRRLPNCDIDYYDVVLTNQSAAPRQHRFEFTHPKSPISHFNRSSPHLVDNDE